jgi:hypothetical protein
MNNFSKNKVPPLTLSSGWNEFATFHGLVENDRLIFALKAMSTFEVYIFHPTGEPKEPPTSREQVTEVQELLQKKSCKKSWESARNLQGNGMTVAQLVKLQNAQRLKASRDRKKERKLNARRKKDATPSLELLQRAVDIFEPVDQLTYSSFCPLVLILRLSQCIGSKACCMVYGVWCMFHGAALRAQLSCPG